MEKDLIMYYLSKIENKVKIYSLRKTEALKNDLLLYLEICIELCNMLEKRFFRNVLMEKEFFQDLQAKILLNNVENVFGIIANKKRELESSDTAH